MNRRNLLPSYSSNIRLESLSDSYCFLARRRSFVRLAVFGVGIHRRLCGLFLETPVWFLRSIYTSNRKLLIPFSFPFSVVLSYWLDVFPCVLRRIYVKPPATFQDLPLDICVSIRANVPGVLLAIGKYIRAFSLAVVSDTGGYPREFFRHFVNGIDGFLPYVVRDVVSSIGVFSHEHAQGVITAPVFWLRGLVVFFFTLWFVPVRRFGLGGYCYILLFLNAFVIAAKTIQNWQLKLNLHTLELYLKVSACQGES